jgi:hypothetical protein
MTPLSAKALAAKCRAAEAVTGKGSGKFRSVRRVLWPRSGRFAGAGKESELLPSTNAMSAFAWVPRINLPPILAG